MTAGRILESERTEYRDEQTGLRMWRLTAAKADSVHAYFTGPTVTAAGDFVVFSSNRDGGWQIYAMETASGRIIQLTDDPGVKSGFAVASVGRRVFYHAGDLLKVVSIDDQRSRTLYRLPAGFSGGLPSANLDGRYVAFAYREELATSTERGVIYSTMHEMYFQHPRCVIMRIDGETGDAMAAWGEVQWISHVIIHPTNPDCILFCHEGGKLVAQRLWLLEHDPSGRRPRPKVSPRVRIGEHQVAYHEFWTTDGKIMVQVRSDDPDLDPNYHVQCDADGSHEIRYRLPGSIPGHFQANPDNTLWIADRACRTQADVEGQSFMGLYRPDAATASAALRRLCVHATSWKTQSSHPHPSFSADGSFVVFTSDRGGHCQVYQAPADWDAAKE